MHETIDCRSSWSAGCKRQAGTGHNFPAGLHTFHGTVGPLFVCLFAT